MKLRDEENGWRLEFDEDGVVQLIQIDFRLGLFISDKSGEAQLFIETPFEMNTPQGRHVLVPEDTPSLEPALTLFSAKVVRVSIRETGGLTVEFKKDVSIEVYPDDKYEAWQLSGSPEFMLVCAPGGSVAIFREPVK